MWQLTMKAARRDVSANTRDPIGVGAVPVHWHCNVRQASDLTVFSY